MVYWAGAFREGSRGEKALESNTGFRNLLLDNPATTDQCLYKRQKLWLEMREKATFKHCLAASACFFSVAVRLWLEISCDLAPVGMVNVALERC